MISTNIGKYKIIRLVGEGGMASVYEAVHETLGTKVAIKVLNPILSTNTQIRERFRNEAKLMASLDHPNITRVIDYDEYPQQLSITMEYLEGEDLRSLIKRRGALEESEITNVFDQALSAFQYAHKKGIIHRDIKPSNIFILKNGQVKILDFGIAKLFGASYEMTQTGTQIGTPIYMSPEQVKADKTIDHRSDIYSLGVTLFFAINGNPPYNSNTDSQFDIFNKIVYEPLPNFSNQSKFKEIVLVACQKKPEERFQSCSEMHSSLLKIDDVNHSDDTKFIANRTISDSNQDKTVSSSLNKKTEYTTEELENIKKQTTPFVKKISNLTTGQIVAYIAFLIIFIIISIKEDNLMEDYDVGFLTYNTFENRHHELIKGAGITSFILITLNLLSIFTFYKNFKFWGEKYLQIFRVLANIFMLLWSIAMLYWIGNISVNEVKLAWYTYIAFELMLNIRTILKCRKAKATLS